MNFFKLYIGDYQRDTAHLSIAEHGAYMLMLQHYYATEKPLPNGKALHRMLRADSRVEREAIDSVVKQFWKETNGGLINERADVEITKAQTQAETNKSIAVAREAKRKASREQNETSTNRATNDQPNHSHSQTLNPISVNNTSEPDKPTGEISDERVVRKGSLCKKLRTLNIEAAPHLEAWDYLLTHHTDDEIVSVAESVREKSPNERKHLNYLVPILKNGSSPKPTAKREPPWWSSEVGILAKGKELGISPNGGESWQNFKGRINEKLSQNQEAAA